MPEHFLEPEVSQRHRKTPETYTKHSGKGPEKRYGQINKPPHKCRIPIENPGKSEKIQDLGSEGVWGTIFTINFNKRLAKSFV